MDGRIPKAKVILCGEYGVGKSSLFRRFVHDTFVESSDRRSTLGFDHFEKTFTTSAGRQIRLQLWDTGGLERVASVTTSYFKQSDGALLVFAHEAEESFSALHQHVVEVLANAETAKLFLCGNKADLLNGCGAGGPAADEQMDAFLREHQLSDDENLFRKAYPRVSCKTGLGVAALFDDMAEQLSRTVAPPRPVSVDLFQLRSPSQSPARRQTSCSNSCAGGTATSPTDDDHANND